MNDFRNYMTPCRKGHLIGIGGVSMAENGLVKKGSNTVLLTQTGEQTEKNAALLVKASDAASKALTECGLNASAATISRRVVTPDIRTIAEKYGISEGMKLRLLLTM